MTRRQTDKHLPPCVYRKHGGFYLVKANKWSRLGTTLAESLAEYARIHEAPKGGMVGLIDKVLGIVRPKLSAATVASYGSAARILKRMLVDFAPEQVKAKHVAGIKVALVASPCMANRCLTVLSVVFAHAVEWQLVDSNPCLGVHRLAEGKRTRYITDDELRAIHTASGPRLRVIVELLYLTAQRVSDVLAIRRADLSDAGIAFAQKKTGTRLTVPWSPDLRAAVDSARALFPSAISLTLLRGTGGRVPHYRSVSHQWAAACKAAGVADAHIHDVRAKSLTDAKRAGKDATALAGHASAAMTARYIRLRESPICEGPGGFLRQPLDA